MSRLRDLYDLQRPTEECILWPWAKTSAGYGLLLGPDGELDYAHRLTWKKEHGDIPAGMYICHYCDVPACINVKHLFLGTAADNRNDCQTKGRRPEVTTCPQGHEYTSTNTYINPNGSKECRECRKLRVLKHRHPARFK